jgi:hypothetical protein
VRLSACSARVRGRHRRPPGAGAPSRIIERGRDPLVWARRSEGEVPSLLLGVAHDGRETGMHFAPPPRARPCRHGRAQQGMAEANTIAVELENAGLKRVAEPGVGPAPDCLAYELDRRLGEARHGLCDSERGRAQPVETLLHERFEVRREGELLPGRETSAAPLERARQLEREEWVPPGRLPDTPQRRTRKRAAEPVAQELVERADAERPELNRQDTLLRPRAPQPGRDLTSGR